MNLVSSFMETARCEGDRPAIVAPDGTTISFADLAQRSARLAAHWRNRGLQKGARVLVAMPVGIELYIAIAALWRVGAVIVFPEPATGLPGIRTAAEIVAPRALLLTGLYRVLPLLAPQLLRIRMRLQMRMAKTGDVLADVGSEDPALISFTSGSTGSPKAIVRSHGFLNAQNDELRDLLAPTRADETDLVAFPVFVVANLALGVTSVLPNWRPSRPDRATFRQIADHVARHRVTRLLVQPSIAEIIARGDTALPVHTLFTGGGPVFPDLLESLARRLPRTEIVSVYGSTEAEPIAHQAFAAILEDQWRQMRSGAGLLAGRPTHGTRVRIIDDEIVVSGKHVNRGYLGGVGDADNKLKLDGETWHRTGDAGHIDPDGFLWLLGRCSAKAGSLYPFQVEIAARFWPGVTRAALVPGLVPPTLAIEGTEPAAGIWLEQARSLGVERVLPMRIPLDRRHRSKVDYVALRRMLSA